MLDEIEEALIRADLGVEAAARVTDAIGQAATSRTSRRRGEGGDRRRGREGARRRWRSRWSIGGAKPFVILVVGVNGSGKTTTIGKLAAKLSAEGRKVRARRGRHVPRRRDRPAEDLGQRTGAKVIAREPGADSAGPRLRRADAGAKADSADVRDRRHRRPPAEPRRADGRAGKDRARDQEGRRDRAARRAAGARRHRRPERAVAGRGVRQDRRRHRPGDDQARRHRARRHSGRHRARNSACRSISSASARASTTSRRSRPRISARRSRGWSNAGASPTDLGSRRCVARHRREQPDLGDGFRLGCAEASIPHPGPDRSADPADPAAAGDPERRHHRWCRPRPG